jgi:hypothetical protein
VARGVLGFGKLGVVQIAPSLGDEEQHVDADHGLVGAGEPAGRDVLRDGRPVSARDTD